MGSDSDEFERIAAENRRRLLAIARSYAPGAEAEDLYQDILLQLWRSLPSFEGRSSVATWVYRVALNTAIAHRRRASVRLPVVGGAKERPAAAAPAGRSELEILDEFIQSLDAINRALFLLYLEDLSYRDMSEITGLTESHVGLRINRIKRAFVRRYIEA